MFDLKTYDTMLILWPRPVIQHAGQSKSASFQDGPWDFGTEG